MHQIYAITTYRKEYAFFMKLRLFPVALTFVITGGLLFGGWYAYQSLAVDNPLYGQIESIAGIDDFTLETSRDRVAIRVKLDERADLPAVWTTLHEQMKPYAGQRQLYIRVTGEASPELDRLWSTALFDVAEAMDARRYGDIPDRMLELEQAADASSMSFCPDGLR